MVPGLQIEIDDRPRADLANNAAVELDPVGAQMNPERDRDSRESDRGFGHAASPFRSSVVGELARRRISGDAVQSKEYALADPTDIDQLLSDGVTHLVPDVTSSFPVELE
jgi:hypothetical protein